jgi:hypothetical protein
MATPSRHFVAGEAGVSRDKSVFATLATGSLFWSAAGAPPL